MTKGRTRTKPLGAVGRVLVGVFDAHYGGRLGWTQSMIARDTGFSESSVSRHLSASRINLDTALTYKAVYPGIRRIESLAPDWREPRRSA